MGNSMTLMMPAEMHPMAIRLIFWRKERIYIHPASKPEMPAAGRYPYFHAASDRKARSTEYFIERSRIYTTDDRENTGFIHYRGYVDWCVSLSIAC